MAISIRDRHYSLVKYDTPIQVSTTKGQPGKGRKPEKVMSPTEDILNSILPPREWTEDGQLWVQYVSSTPATRSDVIALQEDLDQKLQQRQARETGICPIREELYAQCFDELIRQVTINCEERGLLLLRVRDEIRTTIASYQMLYESSIAFGMRKALQAEQKKQQMVTEVKELDKGIRELRGHLDELKSKCELLERKDSERREEETTKHREEVEQLKKRNQHLKKELEQLLSIPTVPPGAKGVAGAGGGAQAMAAAGGGGVGQSKK